VKRRYASSQNNTMIKNQPL